MSPVEERTARLDPTRLSDPNTAFPPAPAHLEKAAGDGSLYLQDAVCLLPARADLDENMQYIAAQIEEMGGTCYLFSASALLPGSGERLTEEFRNQADCQLTAIIERLDKVSGSVDSAASPSALERAEGELKRERIAFLRGRRLAFFGSTKESEVDSRLDALKRSLDDLYRSGK